MNQWLALLLDTSLKSVVILTIAFCAASLLKHHSAALRHAVWAMALILTALLPASSLLFPHWPAGIAQPMVNVVAGSSDFISQLGQDSGIVIQASAAAGSWNPARIALYVWLIGFGTGAIVLFSGLARLAVITHRGRPIKSLGSAGLLESSSITMPLTWGILRPVVLLPPGSGNWSESRMRIVLGHELAHVRRNDWIIQLIAEFTRIVYWFNPLLWIVCGRIRLEGERAADDAVLNLGTEGTQYASELLEIARLAQASRQAWLPAQPIARHSNLERRFIAMLNPSLDRRGISTRQLVLAAVLAAAILLPVSAVPFPAQVLLVPGQLTGTVYNVNGVQVPNATVIAFNEQSGAREMTTTNTAGDFLFPALQAGHYSVEVLSTDFAGLKIADVAIEPAQTVPLNTMVIRLPESSAEPSANTSERRVRMGGNVLSKQLMQQVKPIYPPAAKVARIQGQVVLETVIGTDGLVHSLRVIEPETNTDLAKAAVESVSKWRYAPTVINGEPMEVLTNITVNFAFRL